MYLVCGLKNRLSASLCSSESPHSEPGALDEVDNGPNTSDEGEQPNPLQLELLAL